MRHILIAFLIGTLISGPVAAQPSSQPVKRTLPKGRLIQNHKAYTLEEMKTILHIYVDYKKWFDIVPEQKRQLKLFEDLTVNQAQQLKLRGQEVKTLREERKLLTKKWTEENRLRHLAENKPSFGSWIAWGTAAAMAALAAVLGGILIAKD